MFEPGELIIYGSTGVCRVEGVATREMPGSGQARLYYALQPLYSDCSISAPVDSDKVFMRPIISRDAAEQLIDCIPGVQVEIFHSRFLRQLSEHYEELLKSHDCHDLLELTMSIYAKKQDLARQKRKFGATDERFMRHAEELLFGELAAALNIPRDKVQDYISRRVGQFFPAADSVE